MPRSPRCPNYIGASSRCGIFRGNGLRHDRTHAGTKQRRPTRDSRTSPRGDAKTSENHHRSFLLNAMVTIHENINEFLAADLHGELSESEREELHTHLMECAECRSLHKEEQLIHKVLQATVERAKPPLGFEQRMASSFRNRIPNRSPRLSGFFVNALRWRAIQAVGLAALFFVLVQMGRVLTGDADLNLSR